MMVTLYAYANATDYEKNCAPVVVINCGDVDAPAMIQMLMKMPEGPRYFRVR
jgi:hypothetical protein